MTINSLLQRAFRRPRNKKRPQLQHRPRLERLEDRRVFAVGVGGDFDGDAKSDLAVWRPDDGTWYVRESSEGFNPDTAMRIRWGNQGDIPIKNADFDGDRKADLAVWRPQNGTWYVLTSSSNYNPSRAIRKQWGKAGDIPLQDSDFDGDGKTDMGVWRPSNGTFYVLNSSTNFDTGRAIRKQWGRAGDVPLQGTDFDSDGKTDLAVWRPQNGTWYAITSGTGYNTSRSLVRQWGRAGDVPLHDSDFDGDGRTDMAVWRPSNGTWYVKPSSTGWTGNTIRKSYGVAGDVPLSDTDLDGDGKDDISVYRPSDGSFYVSTSSTGFSNSIRRQTGMPGATPQMGADFDGDGRTDLTAWKDGVWKSIRTRWGYTSATTDSWGVEGDSPLMSRPSNDSRNALYVNFDGADISRSDLVRWAGDEWRDGPDGWNGKIDGDKNGVDVSPLLDGIANREQVIRRTIELMQEDLLVFGMSVQRIDGLAPEKGGSTTLFFGPSTTGVAHIASTIDKGNNNETDIGFIGEEQWEQAADGIWGPSTGASFSVEGTALAMADVGLHEAGHTYGLVHVESGASPESMGLRYSSSESQWIADTSFLDQDFDERSGSDTQSAYREMLAWQGEGFRSGTDDPSDAGSLTLHDHRNHQWDAHDEGIELEHLHSDFAFRIGGEDDLPSLNSGRSDRRDSHGNSARQQQQLFAVHGDHRASPLSDLAPRSSWAVDHAVRDLMEAEEEWIDEDILDSLV